jgi:hypothetical protein
VKVIGGSSAPRLLCRETAARAGLVSTRTHSLEVGSRRFPADYLASYREVVNTALPSWYAMT